MITEKMHVNIQLHDNDLFRLILFDITVIFN